MITDRPSSAGDVFHIRRRIARVGSADVRYQVVGSGEPVVLVHGLSGSTRWWARTVPALAAHYSVYTVDLPGFGGHRRFPHSLRFAELSSWLLQWLDAVGLERIRLVGHSMGGALAIQIGAQRPDAIQQLVLAAPAAIPSRHATMQSYLLPLAAAIPTTSPTFLPTLAFDALRAGPRTLLRISRDLITHDASDKLARVTAPTLLIWGRRDTLVSPLIGPRMRRALPNADLHVIEGAGHVVMYDRADEFNRAVIAFFAGEPRRRPD